MVPIAHHRPEERLSKILNFYRQLWENYVLECGSNFLLDKAVANRVTIAEKYLWQPHWKAGCEDWEFALRLAAKGNFAAVNIPLV